MGLLQLTFVGVLVQWIDVGALDGASVANDASSVIQRLPGLFATFKIRWCTGAEVIRCRVIDLPWQYQREIYELDSGILTKLADIGLPFEVNDVGFATPEYVSTALPPAMVGSLSFKDMLCCVDDRPTGLL